MLKLFDSTYTVIQAALPKLFTYVGPPQGIGIMDKSGIDSQKLSDHPRHVSQFLEAGDDWEKAEAAVTHDSRSLHDTIRPREDQRPFTISNPIYHEFVECGLIHSENVRKIADKTRDKDIPVYIDERSKIIFLGQCSTSENYYEEEKTQTRDEGKFVAHLGGEEIKTAILEDDKRRFEQFGNHIKGNVLDFGCGWGGFLALAKSCAASVSGLELRAHCLAHLKEQNPDIHLGSYLSDFAEAFDTITLFHVLEHIPHQRRILKEIRESLNEGGLVVIEVPHAEDFLIRTLDIPEFRSFTFWSEHLVLHTKKSLETVLKNSGFKNIQIEGYQRYGFTNHLGWFLDRKPGGHEIYKNLEIAEMEKVYKNSRVETNTCDTLIALAHS